MEREPGKNLIYVSANLEDCFTQLDNLLDSNEIEQIQSSSEEDLAMHHTGLGARIRSNRKCGAIQDRRPGSAGKTFIIPTIGRPLLSFPTGVI